MTQEQAVQLSRIYNTLLLVGTKGEDTIIMGDCLKAFKNLLPEIKIDENKEKEE